MERAILDAMGLTPEAAEAVLAMHREELAALPPHLVGAATLQPPADAPALSRETIAAMAPEEINSHWDLISAWLHGT